MNKKNIFKATIILIFITIVCISTTVASADSLSDLANKGKIDTNKSTSKAPQLGRKIYGIVHTAGIIISAGTLMVIAIRYMISSVEQRAEQKKRIPLYITGAVFVFAIAEIANILQKVMNDL